MPAEHERRDVFDRDVQGFSNEAAHARRIQHAGHADDALFRQTRMLQRDVTHGVEWIGDHDQDAVRRVFGHLARHAGDNLLVLPQQIIATHARLPRHARSDHDDVRLLRGVVGIRAR